MINIMADVNIAFIPCMAYDGSLYDTNSWKYLFDPPKRGHVNRKENADKLKRYARDGISNAADAIKLFTNGNFNNRSKSIICQLMVDGGYELTEDMVMHHKQFPLR